MNPDVGGLLEWRHAGWATRRGKCMQEEETQKMLPNTTLEREPTLEGRIPWRGGRNEGQYTDRKIRCPQVLIQRAMIWAGSDKFGFYLSPGDAALHLSLSMTFCPSSSPPTLATTLGWTQPKMEAWTQQVSTLAKLSRAFLPTHHNTEPWKWSAGRPSPPWEVALSWHHLVPPALEIKKQRQQGPEEAISGFSGTQPFSDEFMHPFILQTTVVSPGIQQLHPDRDKHTSSQKIHSSDYLAHSQGVFMWNYEMMSSTCKTIYMTVLLVVFVSCALEHRKCLSWRIVIDKLEKGFPSRKYKSGQRDIGWGNMKNILGSMSS